VLCRHHAPGHIGDVEVVMACFRVPALLREKLTGFGGERRLGAPWLSRICSGA
jgi:hypothetical protein